MAHCFRVWCSLGRRTLFVEVLLVGLKLALATNAPLPPCTDETTSVAHKLCEGGTDAEQSYAQAMVLCGGKGEDEQRVEYEWSQGYDADERASGAGVAVCRLPYSKCYAKSTYKKQGDDAYGEDHWQ